MGHSPMIRTSTGPDWTPTVTYDSGKPAILTGATSFILYIQDPSGTVPERIGGGSVTINNGALGQITYVHGAQDTAIVGKFNLLLQWTNSAGEICFADRDPWEIKER